MAHRPGMRLVMVLGAVLLAGCTPAIPNKVTREEYALYSQWTADRFKSKDPGHLFFSTRTFIFDPVEPHGCGDRLHSSDRVPWSLIKRLHELGQAEYPLDFYTSGNMQIPWPFKETDLPDWKPDTHLIGFSRVAFNRDHNEALFAISNACAAGECGGGHALLAKRENGKWRFRTASCVWVY